MKKLLMILMLILVLTAGAICSRMTRDDGLSVLPEKVTLYLTEESEIITLGLKEYLTGCILGLDLPSCGQQALNAAACAISSTSLYHLQNSGGTFGAQLTDEEIRWISPSRAEELYGAAYEEYLSKAEQAAEYGMAHILTFEEKAIYAPVCRYSAGMTDDGGYPFLAQVEVSYDRNLEEALSTRAFSAEKVMRIMTELTGNGSLSADKSGWFSGAVYENSGALKEIRFGTARVTGEQLRQAFGLRSTAITVEYSEERFVFTAKGWGSNMGMSLNGAAVMARKGNSAKEILAYFFPLAEVSVITEK